MTGSSQTEFAGGGNSMQGGCDNSAFRDPQEGSGSEGLQLMKLETLAKATAGSLEMTQSLMEDKDRGQTRDVTTLNFRKPGERDPRSREIHQQQRQSDGDRGTGFRRSDENRATHRPRSQDTTNWELRRSQLQGALTTVCLNSHFTDEQVKAHRG